MVRIVAASLAVVLLATSSLGLLAALPATGPDGPSPSVATMSLWEAYGRGLVSIRQVDVTFTSGDATLTQPVGFEIRNDALVDLLVDEHVLLLSPRPGTTSSGATTQDGALTAGTIPAGGTVTYGFGDLVAGGLLDAPPWWCTEERQVVHADVAIALGGEILPFSAASILETVSPNPDGTQDRLWDHLKRVPAVVIGKTVNGGLWQEAEEGAALDVVLRATNLAIVDANDGIEASPDAPNARIWDVIPAGFDLDVSTATAGHALTANDDGSTTISWTVSLPAADVTDQAAGGEPTPYASASFSYRMTASNVDDGRVVLPRALASTDGDGVPEAHSATPTLDILRVSSPPTAHAGASYEGVEGEPLTLSAAESTDPDGDDLTYRWDLDGDGTHDTDWSEEPELEVTFGDDYEGTVRVEVSDGESTDTAEASIAIRNADPTVDVEIVLVHNVPRTQGYWNFQCDFEEPPSEDHVGITPDLVDYVAANSEVFAGIGSADDVCAILGGHAEDDRARAELQLMALWLNVGSGKLLFDSPLELARTDSETVAEATGEIESILLDPIATDEDIERAKDLADAMNHGSGIAPALARMTALGTDPGSDDLTFTWALWDGSTEEETFFNDGVGPDPEGSIDGTFPFDARHEVSVWLSEPGAYEVTVTLTDDDGGRVTVTIAFSLEL